MPALASGLISFPEIVIGRDDSACTDVRVVLRNVDAIAYWTAELLAVATSSNDQCEYLVQVAITASEYHDDDDMPVRLAIVVNDFKDSPSSSMDLPLKFCTSSCGVVILGPDMKATGNSLILFKFEMLQKAFCGEVLSIEFSLLSLYYLDQVYIPSVLITFDAKESQKFISTLLNLPEEARRSSAAISYKRFDLREWKLTRCLYDHPQTRNVRDEIRRMKSGTDDDQRCVVEFVIRGDEIFKKHSEYYLREFLEDSDSVVASSSYRSSLRKGGILFVCTFEDEVESSKSHEYAISPEIISRTSWVSRK